ncbi:MAG: hypothetical protein ACTSYD_02505 [Candidatus Heimdallarchaeaceae archaeon]
MSNREYILNTCIAYIRQINYGIAGDYYRRKLHQILEEHTHLSSNELAEILHHLDEYIGYKLNRNYSEEEIKELGFKLFNIIESKMMDLVRKQFSEEDKEFLISQGMTLEEWLTTWSSNMEFDSNGVPRLKECE